MCFEERARCAWPSAQFWGDANAILSAIEEDGRTIDLTVVIDALRRLGSWSSTTELFITNEWKTGWETIQSFLTRHRPKNARVAATIAVSYMFGIFCSLLNADASMDCRKRSLLVGICLGMVYTDAALDDSEHSSDDRQRLAHFLNSRFANARTSAYDATTRAAAEAFAMIEENDTDGTVRERISRIMATHHDSVLRRSSRIQESTDELRKLALALGSQTGHVFAAALGFRPNGAQWQATEALGVWMQFLDDAADVHDDMEAGICTFATSTLRCDGTLDAYWHSVFVASERAVLQTNGLLTRSLGDIAARTLTLLMLVVSGMSFAKMCPDLSPGVSPTFDDVAAMRTFYASWREAYETSVQSGVRFLALDESHRPHIGRLVVALASYATNSMKKRKRLQ